VEVFVAVNVTAPTLFETVSGPGLKVLDAAVVVVPDVGDVCPRTFDVMGFGLTVSVYVQVPESFTESLSVPDTVYAPWASVPVVVMAPPALTLRPVLGEVVT
jgi:hypothetical protein